ncbi:MAG: YheU family protein [Gammaproteobacteria bacterium]|nr:YheU family protein [Gammaproteobacteria bacterium]MYF02956.1 YheU family protein [Gammaproteobacteria bacterium]MYI76705.1 YheU family protein [Gammaproteobacteria bacterium]
MADFVIVPLSRLSVTARNELIEEFITRDSCVWDGSLDEKREQILQALRSERAVITFDTKRNTADIRPTEHLQKFILSHD